MVRNLRIPVQVFEQEKADIESAAIKAGFRSVSAFIRDKCLDRGKFEPVEKEPIHFHSLHGNKRGNNETESN